MSSRKSSPWRGWVGLALLAFGASGPAAAQGTAPVDLFAAIAGAEAMGLSSQQRERLERYRAQPTTASVTPIRVRSVAVAMAATVRLNLPGEPPALAERTDDRGTRAYAMTWSAGGSAPGDAADADMTLVVSGDDVVGTVRARERLYSLRPLGDGLQALIEIDQRRFPPDHPPGGPLRVPRVASRELAPPTGAADAAATYRVLVVYTGAAARAAGNIGALVRLAVAETNHGYANSGVNTRAVLAGAYQTPSAEAGTMDGALVALQRLGDGRMDEVHTRRNRAKADVVILISARSEYCGVSYLNPPAAYAFGVVSHLCATGYYSFAHEIGYIQGARHNPQADPLNKPFPFGHGYYNEAQGWRTIMSYDCPAGCTRVNYWSNPGRRFLGRPMGTASRHHNARVLNRTAYKVANFRQGTP